MTDNHFHETQFFNALRDIFVGAEIEGESGFINLMRIKSRYYQEGVFPQLKKDINEAVADFPGFREELFDKLYTFFQRYFSESGSIYFRYTPLHQNIYEKVYTDDRDVVLFWKTHMLYYVKTDRIFKSLKVEIDGVNFFFDAKGIENKRANEKRDVVFTFREVAQDGTLVFETAYSERGRITKIDDILRGLRRVDVHLSDEMLEKAFRVFEKQSEVDFFINKNARAFLEEQFDLWMYQYLFAEKNIWSAERLAQLQALKEIAYKVIAFISQFEDELVKIWNKPKFVRSSHYVLTLDHLITRGKTELISDIFAHAGMAAQIEEWVELGMLADKAKPQDLMRRIMAKDESGTYDHPELHFLPMDTKYFPDLELRILACFEELDEELDGWLVYSENYQALITLLNKYKGIVSNIYIDPPYNTSASEIIYENKFNHSSWAEMLYDRVSLSKNILNKENGFHICTIDDVENKSLGFILEEVFKDIVGVVTIRNKPSGRPIPNGFAQSHEYAIFSRMNPGQSISRLNRSDEQLNRYREHDNKGNYFWEMLRKAGSGANREDRPTMYYPFIFDLKTENVTLPELEWDNIQLSYKIINKFDDEFILVYPKKDDGKDGRWYLSYEKAKEIINDIKIEQQENGDYWVYYKRRPNLGVQPTTIWTDSKHSATEHGTGLLKALFGEREVFDYPKSVFAIMECLQVTGCNENSESVILDYFAGSGTTAHAVMNLNREDGGSRKYILVEMGEHFHEVILPRIKKIAFNSKWKDGKPVCEEGESGMSQFVKYYGLEQYEDVLRCAHYEDADLFNDPSQDPYHSYVFLRDLKLLDSVELDSETNQVHFHPERLYSDIDMAETLSHLRGKWIKRITEEFVEFEDGEKMSLTDPDWETLKPMVWWR